MTDWPGQNLGCPESGSGSLVPLSKRVAALAIDWAAAYLITYAFFGGDSLVMTLIFALESAVLGMLLGGTFGHLVLGMRVRGLTGPVPWWKYVVRAILVSAVIPAVFMDENNRGLHDRILVTALVRR
ncbi:MAG: hypothetical protein RIS25_447 [Actinomycetota bacterium]|jgi:hypothetical protein